MPHRLDDKATGGRLAGDDIRVYMETFTENYLKGRISVEYETEVVSIRRPASGELKNNAHWIVLTSRKSEDKREREFDKIILCTGVRFSQLVSLNDCIKGKKTDKRFFEWSIGLQ
jgi:dimethylaniline monooxygenase (N-oxide forming)